LYNSFDAISSLALSGQNKDVYVLMKALGNFYKKSLSKGSEVIKISEEIDIVKNYLIIQQYRYSKLFNVKYDLDKECDNYQIVKLTLQPLVENSIYHGIKPKYTQGNILIKSRFKGKYIRLTIEDDGLGIDKIELEGILNNSEATNKLSFGLKSTIERLKIFYGKENLVSVESQKGVGTKIVIDIPLAGGMEIGKIDF
jgi:two-component system sensor histidine kinase YesM